MTKNFRKLIGLMLCVCLLLPYLPAVALGEADGAGITGNGTAQVDFTIYVKDMNDIDRVRPRSVIVVLDQYDKDGRVTGNEFERSIEIPKAKAWEDASGVSERDVETVPVKWEDLPGTDENGYLYRYDVNVKNDNSSTSTRRTLNQYYSMPSNNKTSVSMPWGDSETKRDLTVNFYKDGEVVRSVELTGSKDYKETIGNISGCTYSVAVPGETSSSTLKALADRLIFTYGTNYEFSYIPKYGNLSFDVPLKEENSSTGMAFDLYKVAEPGQSATGWEPLFQLSGVSFNETITDIDDFAKKLTESVTETLKASNEVSGTEISETAYRRVVVNGLGSITTQPLSAGIYYGRRVEDTGNPLVRIKPFIFSISPFEKGKVTSFSIGGDKIEYITPKPMSVSVKKVWDDDDDFDVYRPDEITFQLQQNGKDYGDPEVVKKPVKEGEEWAAKWEDLPAYDEQGKRYNYTVKENSVKHYSGEATGLEISVSYTWPDDTLEKDKKDITLTLLRNGEKFGKEDIKLTKSNKFSGSWTELDPDPDYKYTFSASVEGAESVYDREVFVAGMDTVYSYTYTNTHTPEYGYLQISKKVLIDDEDPADFEDDDNRKNIADGTYYFAITGPEGHSGKPYYHENDTLKDSLKVSIVDGKADSSGVSDKLKPGDYTITEVRKDNLKGLPEGMKPKENPIKVTVKAGTNSNPTVCNFVNEMTTGSLKLTKSVVYDYNDKTPGNSVVNATFNFTVTGPGTYTTVVPIKITNSKAQTVELKDLEAGSYTITEGDYTINSASRQYESFIKPSPTTVELKIKAGDKSPTVTAEFVNRLVTPSPSPTPTPTPTRSNTTGGGGGGGGNNRTNPPSNNTTPPPGETTPPPGETTPPPSTEPPEETPTPTPTPEPTPTPTPMTNVTIRKVWDDDSNTHRTRPASITVQLLRNGEQINMASMTGTGDNWSFTFSNLPAVDQNGTPYNYLARELSVNGYTTELNGTTITNHLIRKPPERYISISGIKIWRDMDNASGQRPNQIVVRLMRDGVEVERRTVTSLQNWQFSFNNIPEDDGFGNKYTYTIQEEAVNGYFARFEGSTITNSRLPERPYMPPATGEEIDYETFRDTGTPLAGFPMGEGDLEELLTLYDYPMPLWGEPMKTGDEMPIYPIIFGSVGLCALVAVIVLSNMEKKKKRKGA